MEEEADSTADHCRWPVGAVARQEPVGVHVGMGQDCPPPETPTRAATTAAGATGSGCLAPAASVYFFPGKGTPLESLTCHCPTAQFAQALALSLSSIEQRK